MRLRPAFIVLFLTLLSTGSAYGATDITGDIYGKQFENLVMKANGTNANGQLFDYGVTIDDISAAGEDCDNTNQTCNIKGFSWSDRVGWTFWDGLALQSEIGSGDFPDEYIAVAAYNGNIGGYIWGEKFGWISLSSCNGLGQPACTGKTYCEWNGVRCEVNKATRIPDVSGQSLNDWGIYIDFCPQKATQGECESLTADPYCNWDSDDPEGAQCVFDSANNPDGQPLGGFAWSEYLGWIKFGPEAGEQGDFAGAFTNWFPDMTPPEFTADVLAPSWHAWIPNESPAGAIEWAEFVDEDDSFVDLNRSTVAVTKVIHPSGYFDNCPNPDIAVNGNLVISLGATGEANFQITNIGRLGTTPELGYCQYKLGGVLYNQTGYGHYFGDEGVAQYAADSAAAPSILQADPIYISVRAGDLVPTTIGLSHVGNDTAMADGNSTVSLTFSPKGVYPLNPIVSVKGDIDGNPLPNSGDSADWVRKVELLYDLSGSPYAFDSVNFSRNLIPGVPTPIEINLQTYDYLTDALQFPLGGQDVMSHVGGDYTLDVVGYAPSTVLDNHLTLDQIDLYTNDEALPAISPSQGPWPANIAAIVLDDVSTNNILPFNFDFEPALLVTDGRLDSDFLAINQPAEATFTFENVSGAQLDDFSFDHILDFHDAGAGSELLEVEDVNLTTESDLAGRSDPYGFGSTRYGLIYSLTSSDTPQSNQFHENDNFHDPEYTLGAGTNVFGEYTVSGNAFVDPTDPCIGAGNCATVDIDRSDDLAGPIGSGASDSYSFGFMPTRYIGGASAGQIMFDIEQYISYDPVANIFGQHAIYHADPMIDDVLVKSIGLDTSGIVGGQQVYETGADRELDTITVTSSDDLRKEIRRNVAVLTRNMTACNSGITLTSLDTTASDCISKDEENNTIVAYYGGGGTLTLGDGIADVTIPNGWKYTLILDAVDLEIKSNLVYPAVPPNDPNTSFGIIVMKNPAGNDGNVYLAPEPTNMVGLLYAEGSLLSRSAAGDFYHGAGGVYSDLKNQLFWQGSIASANTIGGATSLIVPEGADCRPWPSDSECAQGYDLDFTRRFTTVNDSGEEYAANNALFSGGGSCVAGPPIDCTLGSLPTTVDLMVGAGGGDVIDTANSKSLDAFFIERDNRPVPPGFSSKGGLTSTQEVR